MTLIILAICTRKQRHNDIFISLYTRRLRAGAAGDDRGAAADDAEAMPRTMERMQCINELQIFIYDAGVHGNFLCAHMRK
jgi:hypothetical protein